MCVVIFGLSLSLWSRLLVDMCFFFSSPVSIAVSSLHACLFILYLLKSKYCLLCLLSKSIAWIITLDAWYKRGICTPVLCRFNSLTGRTRSVWKALEIWVPCLFIHVTQHHCKTEKTSEFNSISLILSGCYNKTTGGFSFLEVSCSSWMGAPHYTTWVRF